MPSGKNVDNVYRLPRSVDTLLISVLVTFSVTESSRFVLGGRKWRLCMQSECNGYVSDIEVPTESGSEISTAEKQRTSPRLSNRGRHGCINRTGRCRQLETIGQTNHQQAGSIGSAPATGHGREGRETVGQRAVVHLKA